MRARWVRLTSCVLAFAASGGAAFFISHSEQHIARRRDSARSFSAAVRDVITAVSELRMSQAAYVATGQDVAFWAPKATAAADNVVSSVTLLRLTATTDVARAALDAAGATAALFAEIDGHAREYLEQGMPVMAGDVVLSDGWEASNALVGQIEKARAAEQQAADADEASQRRREAIAAAAAIAIGLFVIVLMTPRIKPAASSIALAESGLDAATSSVSSREDTLSLASVRPAGPSMRAISKLCTDFGRVDDIEGLKSLLGQAASLMDTNGLMVWVGTPDGSELQPALAHGYTQDMLAQMPTLRRSADNAAAAAFRTGKLQVVLAQEGSASGAIVAPMLSSRGCVGVISAETRHGAETSESLQALAVIVAAQLAAILHTASETPEQRATGTN
jgi:hypothetical protein